MQTIGVTYGHAVTSSPHHEEGEVPDAILPRPRSRGSDGGYPELRPMPKPLAKQVARRIAVDTALDMAEAISNSGAETSSSTGNPSVGNLTDANYFQQCSYCNFLAHVAFAERTACAGKLQMGSFDARHWTREFGAHSLQRTLPYFSS